MTSYRICDIITKTDWEMLKLKSGSVSKIVAVMSALLVISIVFGFFTIKSNKNELKDKKETSEYMTEEETNKFILINEEDKTDDKGTTEDETSDGTENKTTVTEDEKISGIKTEKTSDIKKESTTQKKAHSDVKVDGITYINGIMVVNKSYALPSDYNPGVNSEAQSALNEMFSSASNDGISLWVQSGFRSYQTQKGLYENYAAQDGKAAADRYSARPGHSEHQTGLAFDLNSLSTSFGETPEGRWLARNCWKYGFIIRYPQGKESITGYMYEPWHVRYLGKDTAKAVYESGLTLEEYLGINSQYSY